MFEEIFPFEARRKALIEALSDFSSDALQVRNAEPLPGRTEPAKGRDADTAQWKKNQAGLRPCVELLVTMLDELSKPKPQQEVLDQKVGVLLFASQAQLPRFEDKILALLERENGDPAWLGNLFVDDPKSARGILRRWFAKTAQEIRDAQNLRRLDVNLYGKVAAAPGTGGLEDVKLQQPMLYDKYVTLIDGSAVGLEDAAFQDVLLIFALQNVSMRGLLLPRVFRITSRNERGFVLFLRQEHPLVVYRLLPLLAQLGTSASKQELKWIANYHADSRLKLLAQTLERR